MEVGENAPTHRVIPFLLRLESAVPNPQDNFIMLLAGDFIDATLCRTFCLSTMFAAGIGNIISDVVGLAAAGPIELSLKRIGIGGHNLSPSHQQLWSVVTCKVRILDQASGQEGLPPPTPSQPTLAFLLVVFVPDQTPHPTHIPRPPLLITVCRQRRGYGSRLSGRHVPAPLPGEVQALGVARYGGAQRRRRGGSGLSAKGTSADST